MCSPNEEKEPLISRTNRTIPDAAQGEYAQEPVNAYDILMKNRAKQLGESKAQIEPETSIRKGNAFTGLIGAIVFSSGGVVLYFVIYGIGFFPWPCGLATFFLANLGFQTFSGSKEDTSVSGLILAGVLSLVMLFIAEYLCLAFSVFNASKGYDNISFLAALRALQDVLLNQEMLSRMIYDLALAFLFSIAATVGTIIRTIRSK